ncbi:MAG TPA: phosphate acyltransferase PlsX [Solirubrobacteraceae bacterium]|jgi:glycerol-3-phosphate acyltransferase PlsX|nr:phosphate acyltransferase PlsX [Solirubrobacteraceae bacterium]
MKDRPASADGPVVAVDCNGADLGPAEVAAGAALAAARGARVILFGPAAELGEPAAGVEIVDAPMSIAKSADPASAVRANADASIVQAARAVASGRAQALVCAGGTGAALAAGLFNIKRTRGIYRPALALPLPVPGGPVTLLDVGANAVVRREHLVQFAFMGAALSSTVLGVAHPRVGLLSNGEEQGRGSPLVLEAHAELLERAGSDGAFEFVGNVEGGDVTSGIADVVVTDGFTGNIALKLMEGVSQTILGAVRNAATSSTRGKLGGLLLRGALGGFRAEIDPELQGGAYLLGLRRLGVVPHGRFSRTGFAEAIMRAERGAREDIVGRTERALAEAGALRQAPVSAAGASLRET